MPTPVQRDLVTVNDRFGHRQVHYRRAGTGPAVLLLHQSPQSSREMEPLMAAWSSHFTLFAPDSPGYGLSDPLAPDGEPVVQASIDDFAEATFEFADALGLGRFGIYGFHTGASIGAGMAHARPGRVTALAANGLVVLTGAEIDDLLAHYLPPIVPRWDGGHLAWLWARLREQTLFFPWYDHRAETRLAFDVPPPGRLQLGLHEFLAAGDHYRVAYAAAFAYRAERLLPDMQVPVLITATARDPLAPHLARVGGHSPTVQMVLAMNAEEALARSLAHLRAHPGDPGPAGRAPPTPDSALHNAYAGKPGEQLRLRRAGSPTAPRLLLIHPVGGDAQLLDPVTQTLATAFEVIVPDLPGHGASDPPGSEDGLQAVVQRLTGSLASSLASDTAPGTGLRIIGFETGAAVALEVQRQLGSRAQLLLVDPALWSPDEAADWLAQGLPALEPVWSGGHLLEAWHLVRDGRLFHPWFRREQAAIRKGEPALDDTGIHREVRALLRAAGYWQPLLREVISYPLAGSLTNGRFTGGRIPRIGLRSGSAWSRARMVLATDDLQLTSLPADPADWVAWLVAS